jgi:hypothetical protein
MGDAFSVYFEMFFRFGTDTNIESYFNSITSNCLFINSLTFYTQS